MSEDESAPKPAPDAETAVAPVAEVSAVEPAEVVMAPAEVVTKPKPRTAPAAKPVAASIPKPEIPAPATPPARAAAPKPARAAVKVKAPKPVAAQPAAKKPIPPKRKPATVPRFSIPTTAPIGALSTFAAEISPMTTDITDTIKTAFTEAQDKAKAAYETGAAKLSEVGTLAKGNAEAVVESGKIFAEGLQKLSTGAIADSREAFEGLAAEIKEIVAAKSPADFFKLQSDFMRKQFDSAISYGSKHSEAMMKLSTDAIAPLSRRVTVAVETLKTAA